MKLSTPFVRLPFRYDVDRLLAEVRALPPSAWVSHPNSFPGNTASRLITVEGSENDEVAGPMEMTEHLRGCPYIQQILANFGVVWGRSRLMRLAPGAVVPEHSDTNYHWYSRVRLHIPVITRPGVSFHCDDEVVYMGPGEAWIFDNWRRHRVENNTSEERIHLVADTSGTAAFWNMVASAQKGAPLHHVDYRPDIQVELALERFNSFRVMPPSEVEMLLGDLAADLQVNPDSPGAAGNLLQFQSLLRSFCADWRQLWLLYGDSDAGIDEFQRLAQALRDVIRPHGAELRTRSNQLPVMPVLEARVIRSLVDPQADALRSVRVPTAQVPESVVPVDASQRVVHRTRSVSAALGVDRPVFIVSAPRSGSTLLFETLACTPQLWTVGGEAHWLVEGFDHLGPGAPGIDDNRIDARHATPEVAAELKQRLLERLRGPSGEPVPDHAAALRVLEKTPKNALRIPFFAKIFPDARFVFLWRDPRENLSSIMEAWRSGGWVTYSDVPGWDGDWSLLLPPGWRALRGKSLAEIAAFQWECTNRIALDDLSLLPKSQWTVVNYEAFLSDTAGSVRRLCDFSGIEFDDALRKRVSATLPNSRHTLTKPDPHKWLKNKESVDSVLPKLRDTWHRLASLADPRELADGHVV